VVPHPGSRLSDGVVIETSVLARLFGIRLLTLEGTVLVTPAQVQPAETFVPEVSRDPLSADQESSRSPRSSRVASAPTDVPPGRVGHRLGEAARLLQQSSDEMSAVVADEKPPGSQQRR